MVPVDALSEIFPEGAWQRGVCKRLQTTSGNFMLLFQNWEQTSDDRWKLWPISVVIGRDQDGQPLQQPVVLEAESGAEIRFTESLDMLSGNAPPIHDGRLNGIVEIRRQGDQNLRHLMIRTANVGIDNRKVWTTEAIQMMFGDARVIGRDLTLHLANATGTIPSSGGAAAVLDRMELIYLDEMVVPLHDGPLWQSGKKPVRVASASSAPASLSLNCGGRVEYDFALDKLTMRNSVALVHSVVGGSEDRFECDALELSLRDPTNRDLPRDSPLDWLSHITAYGSPVTIRVPSFDLSVAAEHIDFKAKEGLLIADGRTGVEVRHGGFLGRLTQLGYFFNPRNPKEVGNLHAYGAGLVRVDNRKIPLREIRWTEQMSFKPDGVTTTDQLAAGEGSDIGLWIDGDVEAKFTDGGSFRASSIECALQPTLKSHGSQQRPTLAARRITASHNVHLDTRAIAADTTLLELFFVEPPPGGRSVDGPNHDEGPRSASTMRQWVAQPGSDGTLTDPVARPRPRIRGDSISAELESGDDGIHARDLTVVGSVELTHSITTGGQTLPAKLTGEQLRWRDGVGDDVLQLGSGIDAPARFELGDGYFVGPLIQVWPADNLIEINHAGEFRMPTAVLPTALTDGGPGTSDSSSSLRWTKAPHCRWNEAMRFDGRTAMLTGGVKIEASLVQNREPWDLNLTGDQLNVTLSDDVQIENVQTIRNATVQQISLLRSDDTPVMIRADHRAPDGVLEARHIMQAPQLTMMPEGGKLVGRGPGWYRTWMRSPPEGPLAAGSTAEIDAGRQLDGFASDLSRPVRRRPEHKESDILP